MQQGRFSHTASLLPDGEVFIAGGGSNVTINSSAELYEPASAQFVATTNGMNQGRVFHTATLLPDGDVLMAGGHAGSVLNSAELYDPANQTFTYSTSTMTASRTAHTATLLSSGPEAGMVLLTGGSKLLTAVYLLDKGALKSAELYDSVSDTFTPTTGPMSAARSEHTATFLDPSFVNGPLAGRVLITGGMNDQGGVLASAELYDPASGTFTRTSGAMSTARRLHAAALISGCGCAADGRVLIAGGQGGDGQAVRTAELFNPANGTFTPTGDMAKARFFLTATAFGDGSVLIAGGDDAEDSEIYDPASGKFQFIKPPDHTEENTGAGNAAALLASGQILITGGGELPPSSTSGFKNSNSTAAVFASDGSFSYLGPIMTIPRVGHTATALGDGTVLVAGGETAVFSVQSSTELYDPVTERFAYGPSLTTGRYEHTATLVDGGAQLLIAGGAAAVGLGLKSTASAELYDTASTAFVPTGSMTTARDGATASLIAGCGCPAEGMVLIAGGSADFPHIAGMRSAEIYDPVNRIFTPVGNLVDSRAFQSAAVLSDGTVLLVGGVNQNGKAQAAAEIYDPVTMTFSPTASPPHFSYFNAPATVLDDGTVLLNDGNGHAELYEPMSNPPTFFVTSSPTYSASYFTATLLGDNEVLFAGGFDPASHDVATTDTELFSPASASGVFSVYGPLIEARGAHAATSLSDGSVLITGGKTSDVGTATLSSAELLPAPTPAATPSPIAAAEVTATDGSGPPPHREKKDAEPEDSAAGAPSPSSPQELSLRAQAMMQHELELRRLASPGN
jgi:galactose oxidase-like protein